MPIREVYYYGKVSYGIYCIKNYASEETLTSTSQERELANKKRPTGAKSAWCERRDSNSRYPLRG